MKLFISLFLFLTVSAEAENKETPSINEKSIHLGELIQQGKVQEFRIEMEKLLHGSAKDFYETINALVKQDHEEFPLKFYSPKLKHSTGEVNKFAPDSMALMAAMIPPIRKRNKDGHTAVNISISSKYGNRYLSSLGEYKRNVKECYEYEIADVASRRLFGDHGLYERIPYLEHELHEGKAYSIWSQFPQLYTDEQSIIWRQLPSITLEETPVAKALLIGDSKAFRKALQMLYDGPAWELFAILHSRTKENGNTLFHLAAEFQPQQLKGVNLSELTEEQKLVLMGEQMAIADMIMGLIDFITPDHIEKDIQKIYERNAHMPALAWVGIALGSAVISETMEVLDFSTLRTGFDIATLSAISIACYKTFKEGDGKRHLRDIWHRFKQSESSLKN